MECNPFNISTGEHESFTFLEIVSFLVALFILILIYIKGSEDKGLLLFPDTSAELPAAHSPDKSILGLQMHRICNSAQREIIVGFSSFQWCL